MNISKKGEFILARQPITMHPWLLTIIYRSLFLQRYRFLLFLFIKLNSIIEGNLQNAQYEKKEDELVEEKDDDDKELEKVKDVEEMSHLC